jgi:hypothetical protein
MDSDSELSNKLGLRPYAKFEQIVSPVLARLATKDRELLLRRIYALAAQKVLMDGAKVEVEGELRTLRQRRRRVAWTRAHVQNARTALLKAESRFPDELPRWFDVKEMIATLAKMDNDFAQANETYLSVEKYLENLEGTKIQAQTTPPGNYSAVFPGRKNTFTDHWFVAAVNKLLPTGLAGKKPSVWPNKLIQQVFKAAFGELREIERIKKLRGRLPKGSSNDREHNR